MKTHRTLLRAALLGLSAAAMLAGPAAATPFPAPVPSVPETVVPVSGNCSAIGRQRAAQVGGELMRATQEMRGGQRVCVIIVRVPGQGGGHPRIDQIVVPAG